MADNNSLRKIRELVLADQELQERLRPITDKAEFTDALLRLAKENGHVLTADDVADGMRAGRRSWIERWV
jgi:hypothetical protein